MKRIPKQALLAAATAAFAAAGVIVPLPRARAAEPPPAAVLGRPESTAQTNPAAAIMASTAPSSPPLPSAGPTRINLTVRPQPTSRPALRLRLLPPLTERTPGDAAPVYLLAAILANRQDDPWSKPVTDDDARRFGLPAAQGRDWTDLFLDAPLAQIASPDLDKYLGASDSVVKYLEIAGRRETCRWDLPLREQGFSTLLPHLAPLRRAARSVSVKARAELARGDFPAALRTLRSNFALARAMNEQAVMIQSLVATAVGAQAMKVVREAAEQPGCPNLYWPLTDLPVPLVDLRTALEWERASVAFTIPQLGKARTEAITEDDWRAILRQLAAVEQLSPGLGSGPPRGGENLGMAVAAMVMFPQARKHLIDLGRPAAEVDAMPPTAVLARYLIDTYDEVYDELTKWADLPYWQGKAGAAKASEEFAKRARGVGSNPLFQIVPAVDRAVFQVRRLDREVAVTRAVEALRAYAGTHLGTLPNTLEEVTDTPVPLDPITGKLFVYKVEGRTVTLESPAPAGERPADGLVVTVTFVK